MMPSTISTQPRKTDPAAGLSAPVDDRSLGPTDDIGQEARRRPGHGAGSSRAERRPLPDSAHLLPALREQFTTASAPADGYLLPAAREIRGNVLSCHIRGRPFPIIVVGPADSGFGSSSRSAASKPTICRRR